MSSRKETKTRNPGWCLGVLTAPGAAGSKSHLWLVAFQQRSVWVRGAKLGLSVGVLQAIINQGDVWLAESETLGTVVKTIVSPLITFSVALTSAAATYVEKLKLQS
jgi:hypothetical protein